MHLYNLTIHKPSVVQRSIYGWRRFSPKTEEFIISRGNTIELWRLDESGNVNVICSYEIYGLILSLKPFRLSGNDTDFILIGSDSGRIVVLRFNGETNAFEKIHKETFGKVGVIRGLPGQYLAVDPTGRAFMISAIEKQNLVYVLNRDSKNNVTISSPLEAHKSQTIVLTTEGLDVGYDNPIFACLELNYAEADEDPTGEAAAHTEKLLTFYQLDLVPGVDGPGGVLVFAENWVLYRNEGHPELRVPIPRREFLPEDKGVLIVAWALFHQRDKFFYLAQSELGDVFKITLSFDDSRVHDLTIQYFDTLPVATSLHITKHGLLLATSEVGDHCVYQFFSLGDGDVAEASFSTLLGADGSVQIPLFSPRELTNIKPIHFLPSLAPLIKLHAADLRGEGSPQLYALCGRGSRAQLKVLQHGLSVSLLSQNTLPYAPRGLWTLRDEHSGCDKFMVISFNNATIVLSVGDAVEQVNDTGFKADEATLLAGGSYLQVCPGGFRQIFEDGHTKVRQVVVALSNGEMVYFELDEQYAWAERESLNRKEEVTCSPHKPYRTCRVYSLAPTALLEEISMITLDAISSDLSLDRMRMGQFSSPSASSSSSSSSAAGMATHATEMLLLTVGTENGTVLRVEVDERTGKLGTARSPRLLGPRPIRLFKVVVEGQRCVLALSLKPWLCYCAGNTMMLTPLVCESLAAYPGTSCLILLETEHHAFSELEKQAFYQQHGVAYVNEYDRGAPVPADREKWASCIRVVDAATLRTLERFELADNEAAFSVCVCPFHDKGEEPFVVIGTAKKRQEQH
ncbi:hypothetical protein WA577_005802 [Blastocystis sp. JDR]